VRVRPENGAQAAGSRRSVVLRPTFVDEDRACFEKIRNVSWGRFRRDFFQICIPTAYRTDIAARQKPNGKCKSLKRLVPDEGMRSTKQVA
jgi:hypothetical protein